METTNAFATTKNGKVSGSVVTYSNDPANPEGFGSFFRELGSLIESAEPVRKTDPEGFRDWDPVPANMERNRKREREELKRNREYLRKRSGNVTITNPSGSVRAIPEPAEPVERDGVHNRTYSATIGIGNHPVSEIAEFVFQSLGKGYGFQIIEGLGYWEGIPERCVSIVFQGTESRFRSILRTLAISLPEERFAHVAISNPETEYSDFGILRDQVRKVWEDRSVLRADPGIGFHVREGLGT